MWIVDIIVLIYIILFIGYQYFAVALRSKMAFAANCQNNINHIEYRLWRNIAYRFLIENFNHVHNIQFATVVLLACVMGALVLWFIHDSEIIFNTNYLVICVFVFICLFIHILILNNMDGVMENGDVQHYGMNIRGISDYVRDISMTSRFKQHLRQKIINNIQEVHPLSNSEAMFSKLINSGRLGYYMDYKRDGDLLAVTMEGSMYDNMIKFIKNMKNTDKYNTELMKVIESGVLGPSLVSQRIYVGDTTMFIAIILVCYVLFRSMEIFKESYITINIGVMFTIIVLIYFSNTIYTI